MKLEDRGSIEGPGPKTLSKYETDLNKLKVFSKLKKVVLSHCFGCEQFYGYREWLACGHHEEKLREYRLAKAKVVKAKVKPQPCFISEEVELVVANSTGLGKAVFATLGYEGLRVEELERSDVRLGDGDPEGNPGGEGREAIRG